ncbi:hypothetical protein RhiirA5_384232 [Rhizophagus irregularis]|uniref:Uncharacterized protein n=1 Tax=Rhizophagus irregularis TaxID=588596 RepID=A0A2N0NTZ2_9GLOM|nr:hypothetical protein RhiirA5_384232 [Rhizophagus irregularis]
MFRNRYTSFNPHHTYIRYCHSKIKRCSIRTGSPFRTIILNTWAPGTYLLEYQFWMSEVPISEHGRSKYNISFIDSIDPIDPYRLIFSSRTELNDFGASSQTKLTPSARFSAAWT